MTKNWLDNICVNSVKNCKDCPPGTECCREHDKKSGKEGNVLSCTAPSSCDQATGHPTKNASAPCPMYSEGYSDSGGNGCGSKCDGWKWAMVVVIFISLIFAAGFIVMSLKYRNSMGR